MGGRCATDRRQRCGIVQCGVASSVVAYVGDEVVAVIQDPGESENSQTGDSRGEQAQSASKDGWAGERASGMVSSKIVVVDGQPPVLFFYGGSLPGAAAGEGVWRAGPAARRMQSSGRGGGTVHSAPTMLVGNERC